MNMLSNPLGKKAEASAPAPATPATKTGCCHKASPEDTYGMIADDKRKCRDIFCCTLFM
jgi:hypothetical protein